MPPPPSPGQTTRFDPSKYLTKLGNGDYLEVRWRLVWLRDRAPNAGIDTTLVMHEVGEQAVFMARITLPTGGYATGWGSETAADFRDYLEKAETKAIGRALAALGFGTQFTSEHDFSAGARKMKVVDSPIDFSSTRGRRLAGPSIDDLREAIKPREAEKEPPAPQMVTGRQLKFIQALALECGLDEAAVRVDVQDNFGCAIEELGRREASEYIERLQSLRSARPIADVRGGRAGQDGEPPADPPGWPGPQEWGRWLRLIDRAEDAHAVETIRDAYTSLVGPFAHRQVMDAIDRLLTNPELFERVEPHDVPAGAAGR